MSRIELDRFDDAGLLGLWAQVTDELRARGIVRSANNPIADRAERIVADLYGVEPEVRSTAGYDLISKDKERIQVKAVRLTQPGRSSLSAIRNLEAGEFDVLIVVVFERDLSVKEIWRFPRSAVEDHARWSAHVNAHRLSMTKKLRADPRAERIELDAL